VYRPHSHTTGRCQALESFPTPNFQISHRKSLTDTMRLFSRDSYFLALSVLATFLLWGISLLNGTVKSLILASWYGVFEDGTPFTTRYTGVFIVDFPISLLVAFFFFGTNGSVPPYQHFLIDAYSTLQSAFIWLYVESGRQVSMPSVVAK
jgi:hypothetical protein